MGSKSDGRQKEKYTDLQVLLILNAPNNAEERLEFEAEMYAYQNKQVARMTAIQSMVRW